MATRKPREPRTTRTTPARAAKYLPPRGVFTATDFMVPTTLREIEIPEMPQADGTPTVVFARNLSAGDVLEVFAAMPETAAAVAASQSGSDTPPNVAAAQMAATQMPHELVARAIVNFDGSRIFKSADEVRHVRLDVFNRLVSAVMEDFLGTAQNVLGKAQVRARGARKAKVAKSKKSATSSSAPTLSSRRRRNTAPVTELVKTLGAGVDAMLAEMSWPQLCEWATFYRLQPLGEDAAWLRHGIACALLANINIDRKKSKPLSPLDFMPFADKPKDEEVKKASDASGGAGNGARGGFGSFIAGIKKLGRTPGTDPAVEAKKAERVRQRQARNLEAIEQAKLQSRGRSATPSVQQ